MVVRGNKCTKIHFKIYSYLSFISFKKTRAKKSTKWYTQRNICLCFAPKTDVIISPVLIELQRSGKLCDGTIYCEDGTEHRIHKMMIAAASKYFNTCFTHPSKLLCDKPKTMETTTVAAPGATFQKFIDYTYTGTCDINDDCVEELIYFASLYKFNEVVNECSEYIIAHLEPENCIGLLRFGRQYFCKHQELLGKQYLRVNISDVLENSKEFLLLPKKDVVAILLDDALNIKNEEMVFNGIKKWVEFNEISRIECISDLIKTVRLGLTTKSFLTNEILKWPVITKNVESCELVRKALILKCEPRNCIRNMYHPLFRPRLPYDIIITIGGWDQDKPANIIETYDSRADGWLISDSYDYQPRAYYGLCVLNGLIYILGGIDSEHYYSTMHCYNPENTEWVTRANMYEVRAYFSAVMLDGLIYAIGGFNGTDTLKSVERYDSEGNQWEMIQPMNLARQDASAAVMEKKIYIVGGSADDEVWNSVEVYDTSVNQWSFIVSMAVPRCGLSLVAVEDTLYAMGGYDGAYHMSSCEMYSLKSRNNWVEFAPMLNVRTNFGATLVDGYIIVMGGYDGRTTIELVECYDIKDNDWFPANSMNLGRSAFCACVVSGLKNLKQYSMTGCYLTRSMYPKPKYSVNSM